MNAPRNVALSGALLAAILVVRSPLGGSGGWGWLLLAGVSVLRLALGDRTRLEHLYRRGKLTWVPLALVVGLQVVDRNYVFALGLAILYLLPVTLPVDPTRSTRLHPVHHATWAGALLLLCETFGRFLLRDRAGGRAVVWIPYVDGTWQDFLTWLGVLALLTALIVWIEQTIHLRRGLRAARDHTLRLKLAPHFIFNTLNTLKAQLERDPQEAGATVDRLAALYRQVLERTERPTTPLREELDFVEAYLGIEQARLGSRLRVTIDVPEGLEERSIPTLGLQTLVENAVKHGIAPREDGGALLIRIAPREDPRWLQVSVESPALPGDGALALSSPGTGLRTLRARLASPSALRTEVRDGRFLASFTWESPEAAPPIVAATAPARVGA